MNEIPSHIAVIMDGNGRWAAARGASRAKGHEAGAKAADKVIDRAAELGVKFLTFFAFSTENWQRPESEVKELMKLLERVLDSFEKYAERNMRIWISGRREGLSEKIIKKINSVTAKTADNTGLTINIALNYGARQEITDAVNKWLSSGGQKLTDEELSKFMYSPSLPDPELIIRTSGEKRLSNFLLWQAAYSEFYFTEVLWPDFDGGELDKAVEEYQKRSRNFGGR